MEKVDEILDAMRRAETLEERHVAALERIAAALESLCAEMGCAQKHGEDAK